MSKKVAANSPSFVLIHAAQNNIPEGDGALIVPLPTPVGVVLRSGNVAVCNLHLPYTDRYVYHIVYHQLLCQNRERYLVPILCQYSSK